MHIRHVVIENVRRFGAGAAGLDLSLPPRGWIVVAGRNGAGKTTFLKVLALALSNSFSHEYTDTSFSWIRPGVTTARSRLTLVPSDDDELQRDANILSTKAADQELVVGDEWKPTHGAMVHGRESDENRAFAGPWHGEPKGWFAAGYGANRRLLGQANAVESWALATSREGAFLTLFRDDASLAHPIRWLMDLDYRRLDPHMRTAEREEAKILVDGVIALLNDDLLGDIEVAGVDSRGLSVVQDGQRLSISNLGAGAQILAALVVDVLRHMHARFGRLRFDRKGARTVVEHSGVVLIDEAEAHLHPEWQRRIGFWFKEHFPNLQFIVSTHSPFICQAADPDGLIRLPAPGEGGAPSLITGDAFQTVVNGGADDAVLSHLFGLEQSHSRESERIRERVAVLEVKEIHRKLTAHEKKELRELRAKLPKTGSALVEQTLRKVKAEL
jgi:energy-coupling factor transporter ATP-binding protein EcfA2